MRSDAATTHRPEYAALCLQNVRLGFQCAGEENATVAVSHVNDSSVQHYQKSLKGDYAIKFTEKQR